MSVAISPHRSNRRTTGAGGRQTEGCSSAKFPLFLGGTVSGIHFVSVIQSYFRIAVIMSSNEFNLGVMAVICGTRLTFHC